MDASRAAFTTPKNFFVGQNNAIMKKALLVTLIMGLIGLTGFKKDSIVYEQVAFNYFVSDILVSDFSDVSAIEFKGETESSYSTLGEYRFCLKPEQKLQSIIKDTAKGQTKGRQRIKYDQVSAISITEFKKDAVNPRLFVYPALRVADKYYVFVLLQRPDISAKYVLELNPDGNISRNCRMD